MMPCGLPLLQPERRFYCALCISFDALFSAVLKWRRPEVQDDFGALPLTSSVATDRARVRGAANAAPHNPAGPTPLGTRRPDVWRGADDPGGRRRASAHPGRAIRAPVQLTIVVRLTR